MEDGESFDFTLSTSHKSKGKEWGVVEISSDMIPRIMEDESQKDFLKRITEDQSLNLLYVALTRAEHTLIIPPELDDFIEGFLAEV